MWIGLLPERPHTPATPFPTQTPKLTYMTDSSNQLHFNYDVNGLFSVIYNGATYYYVQNAQGDACGKIKQLPQLESGGVYV